VAAVAAALLFVEAVGVALLHMTLGVMVDRQDMSLAGLDPDAMTVSTWIAGGLFGLFLAFCGAVLLRTALRDRIPGRLARIVLTGTAVVHGVLAALSVGLVGWTAFVFLSGVLGLLVFTLVAYGTSGDDSVAGERQSAAGTTGTAAPDANPA
jgi:hypothetical protein